LCFLTFSFSAELLSKAEAGFKATDVQPGMKQPRAPNPTITHTYDKTC